MSTLEILILTYITGLCFGLVLIVTCIITNDFRNRKELLDWCRYVAFWPLTLVYWMYRVVSLFTRKCVDIWNE